MFILLAENLLFLLLVIGFIFQVIIPLIQSRPIFPLFRKKAAKQATEWEVAQERLILSRRRVETARMNEEAAQFEAEAKLIEEKSQKSNQQ